MKQLYRLAVSFSGLAILSMAWIAYHAVIFFVPAMPARLLLAPVEDNLLLMTLVVAAICLAVSTIGTASTILVGWRYDRNQIDELKTKLQQAEAQRPMHAGPSS